MVVELQEQHKHQVLAYGGDTPTSPSNATEEYDGTSWTNVNNMAYYSGYYASISGSNYQIDLFKLEDSNPSATGVESL